MTAAALKFHKPVEIPDPPGPLGSHGLELWRKVLTEYGDWGPHELATLHAACGFWQEVHDITRELADETDHKLKRQLRADRRAAGNEMRKHLRELSLSARPNDSRPARIPGRYA